MPQTKPQVKPKELVVVDPKIEAIQTENADVIKAIDTFEIKTAEDCQLIVDYSRRMKAAQKSIAAIMDPGINTMFNAHRSECDRKRALLAPFQIRETLCDQKALAWTKARKAEAEAEAKRVRDEAEKQQKDNEAAEKKRIEDERAETGAKLESLGFTAEAEAVVSAPIVVSVAPVIPAPVAQVAKIAGAHTRDNWCAVIVDPFLLVAEIASGRQSIGILFQKSDKTGEWEYNPKGLDGMAKALKAELLIPGVKVVNRDTLVKR